MVVRAMRTGRQAEAEACERCRTDHARPLPEPGCDCECHEETGDDADIANFGDL